MSTTATSPRSVLQERRTEMIRVLKLFHVTHAGIFGSLARGEDTQTSDIYLIVDFAPEAERDLIRLEDQLSEIAGVNVDVVDAREVYRRAIETGIGTSILQDSVPI